MYNLSIYPSIYLDMHTYTHIEKSSKISTAYIRGSRLSNTTCLARANNVKLLV